MNKTTRLFAPWALAGVLTATLAGAALAPAHAQTGRTDGSAGTASHRLTSPSAAEVASRPGETTVRLTPGMSARLAKTDVSLSTTGAATSRVNHGVTTLRFPVKTTNADGTPTAHRGGVTFRRGSADVHLDHLRLHPHKGTVMATIEHDARAPMFRITTDKTGVARVKLTKLVAGQLNTTFATHRFAGGQTFGTLRPAYQLGQGEGESITLHIINTTKWTLNFDDVDTQGLGTVTRQPADTLKPGQSDEVDVTSHNPGGAELNLTYAIDGTVGPPMKISGFFQVPTFTPNQRACSQDTWVRWAQCSISGGDQVQAYWEPKMTTSSPVLDFGDQGSVWTFRKAEALTKGVAVDGGSDDDAVPVSLWNLNNTRNERWTWVPSADYPGYGQLVNLESGKCLEHNETNGNVDQWPCETSDNHLWMPVYNKTDHATALMLKETDNAKPQYLGLDTDPTGAPQGSAMVLVNTLSNRTSWYPNPVE
jgi:hypothetical protein